MGKLIDYFNSSLETDVRATKLLSMPAPQDVGLYDLLYLAKRRKGMIAAIALCATLLAAIVLAAATPLYTAQTLVMVNPHSANIANLESVVAGLPSGPETLGSEMEVLRSRRLADKVITQLRLDREASFNPAAQSGNWLTNLFVKQPAPSQQSNEPAVSQSLPTLPDDGAESVYPIALSDEHLPVTQDPQRVKMINRFLEHLEVSTRPQSRVLAVNFSSPVPETAARVVNTLAELYIVDQLDNKFNAIRQATAWLNEHVTTLREKVESSERAVEQYREASGLLEGDGITLEEQEISELNSQLILARASRTEAAARQRQVLRLLESPGGVESAGEVLGSTLVQQLRRQEVETLGKVAELAVEYGDMHPKMVKLRAEAADLKSKIDGEINKIVAALASEVAIARAREYSLSRSLNEAKLRVGEANKAGVTLRALEREAQANRMLLETMMARAMETRSQQDLRSQRPDARIISRADIPLEPAYPMKKAILALVLFGAAFLGFILAFFRERLERGFRSGEQIEQVTGVPSLGFIPHVPLLKNGKESPTTYFLENMKSPFAESVRTLLANITTAHGRDRPKSMLFTSTHFGEGKTTVATCLTTLLALDGHRVIIVDADARNPSIHRAFGVANEPGLVELLTGEATIDQVVKSGKRKAATDEYITSGKMNGVVDVIPAGIATRNPPGMLASLKMNALLRRLAELYDYVLVDAPAMLSLSDAMVLSPRVDATIFVVQWGDTKREAVMHCMKKLLNAQGKLSGALISKVDVKEYAQYNYGDSGSFNIPSIQHR